MNASAVGGGQVALLGEPTHSYTAPFIKSIALNFVFSKRVSLNCSILTKYYHILHEWGTSRPLGNAHLFTQSIALSCVLTKCVSSDCILCQFFIKSSSDKILSNLAVVGDKLPSWEHSPIHAEWQLQSPLFDTLTLVFLASVSSFGETLFYFASAPHLRQASSDSSSVDTVMHWIPHTQHRVFKQYPFFQLAQQPKYIIQSIDNCRQNLNRDMKGWIRINIYLYYGNFG